MFFEKIREERRLPPLSDKAAALAVERLLGRYQNLHEALRSFVEGRDQRLQRALARA